MLRLSEVLPDPSANMTEAQAEWIEVEVTAAGELGGWALTDFDGDVDYAFPPGQGVLGERLVVANGHTAPAGLPPGARVFLANKSWWTFDNQGDEVALVAPGGSVADALRWGAGQALDEGVTADRTDGAVLGGATLGRMGEHLAWLRPTPGAANVALQSASTARLELAAVTGLAGAMAAFVCTAGDTPFDPYLWTVQWAEHTAALDSLPLGAGDCLLAGAPIDATVAKRAAEAVGIPWTQSAPFPTNSWNATAAVALVDPWGTPALSFTPPAGGASAPRGGNVWLPCGCPERWSNVQFGPLPREPAFRAVEGMRVVRAGPELELAVVALVDGARHSVVLNAYLLTSTSVREALMQASGRGVSVRVLLEGAPVGGLTDSNALAPKALEAWNNSGVWVRSFDVAAPSPARDHAKYAVADGRAVFVSTENFVGAALSADDPNTGYAIVCNATALAADLLALFEWDFALGADRTTPGSPSALANEAEGEPSAQSGPRAAVLASPESGEGAWVSVIHSASARLDFEVLSADLKTAGPDSPIGRALLDACGRGVAVRGLFSTSYSVGDSTGNLAVARALVAEGAAASCSGRIDVPTDTRAATSTSVLHAKVLVADGVRALLGSHNWVQAAFASNREVSLWVESADASGALTALLEVEFAKGSPVAAGPLPLDGELPLGAWEHYESAAGGPPSFWVMALAGATATVTAVFGALRRGRKGRPQRLGPPRETTFPPSARLPFDPLAREADADSAAEGPPERDTFNPRADPPTVSQRPEPRAGPLPASAFELFEKG